MNQKMDSTLTKASRYIFFGLLGYMPLHIFLSTFVGSTLGILPVAKVAKDAVMIVGFLLIVFVAARQKLLKKFFQDRLVMFIGAYGALTLLVALIRPTDPDAEILGVVYNTRFLVFFLYGMLLARVGDSAKLLKRSVQIVLASSIVVLVFGILQYAVLPPDFLSHFGYSRESGVLPAFFIDDKPDLQRAMSTLRDPNSYGSYLIIVAALAAGCYRSVRKHDVRKILLGIMGLSLVNLLLSFSRSAWLGFALAATVLLVFEMKHSKITSKVKRGITAGLLAFVVIAGVGLYAFRGSYFVQNVLFHADQSTVLQDPNELRVKFWQESLDNIAENPRGAGPGTAGLASIKNEVQGTTLNENYYLQIATETGVLGLISFLAILAVVARRLYARSAVTSPVAVALLASFAGLAITNFLVHIWSNEAVAYTWWGLAGLATIFPRGTPGKVGNRL